MAFSNAQKLSVVVATWAKPVISQLTAQRLCRTQMLQNWQGQIINTGLVTPNYRIETDVAPIFQPMINSLLQPMLLSMFGRVPDENIPTLAHSVVDTMLANGEYTILDGLVTFEKADIMELKQLMNLNLPLQQAESYQLIKNSNE